MQGQEIGTTIRNPATANLFIDSDDLSSGYVCDFTISKNYSLQNGMFHRIAVNEIVLDWYIENISVALGNHIFQVTIAGTTYTASFATNGGGFYDVAECLDVIVAELNTAAGVAGTFSIQPLSNGVPGHELSCTAAFAVLPGLLQGQLNIEPNVVATYQPIGSPRLQSFKYIDFVCNDLTYNQAVKDATSANNGAADVLYRWIFSWDNNGYDVVDKYGYPILQGYKPFQARRYLSFPKQIRWESNMPVGNLRFQVWGNGRVIPPAIAASANFQFQMTLLLSEN